MARKEMSARLPIGVATMYKPASVPRRLLAATRALDSAGAEEDKFEGDFGDIQDPQD